MQSTHKAYETIRQFLLSHTDEIQNLTTQHHKEFFGGKKYRSEIIEKYQRNHRAIVAELANHLEQKDAKKGLGVFKKLAKQVATDSIEDGLHIEESVDGIIFLKQALWEKVAKSGLLKMLTVEEFHHINQIIGIYIDTISSKIAFMYHAEQAKKAAQDASIRKQAESALRKSELRFRTLLKASSQVLYRMNPDWSEMIQLQGGGFLEHTTKPDRNWLQKYIYQEEQKKILEEVTKSVQTGTTFEFEHSVIRKDGSLGWVLSRAVPLRNNKGEIIEWFGAADDITKQKELERQKDEFMGVASHELKTPVTSLNVYIKVLQRRLNQQQKIKDSAEVVHKMDAQIHKLKVLIRDLLDVTRIEDGKLQFRNELFDFDALVDEVIEEIQWSTDRHKIIREGLTKKTIRGDRERTSQVITNFLTNAIKYSPHSKKIFVKTAVIEDSVSLCVQDFGVGIAKEKLPHVFERFYRETGNGTTFPGIGLGLYISREIIQRQKGEVWAESEKGKGSFFCFALPLSRQKMKTDFRIPKYA